MFEALGSGQALTALAGLGGVIVGSLISWGVQTSLLAKRIGADERLVERKFTYDRELADKKFSYDRDLAERKFAQEREQIVYKRRFELAESLLSDIYRFQSLINDARISGSFGGEGATRRSANEEPADIKKAKDSYYIPIERLRKDSEFFAGVFAKRFTAIAQFGPEAKSAFGLLTGVINRMHIASGLLVDMVEMRSLNNQDVQRELLDDLWAGHAKAFGREDKVAADVEKAVAKVEAICRPILERAAP